MKSFLPCGTRWNRGSIKFRYNAAKAGFLPSSAFSEAALDSIFARTASAVLCRDVEMQVSREAGTQPSRTQDADEFICVLCLCIPASFSKGMAPSGHTIAEKSISMGLAL